MEKTSVVIDKIKFMENNGKIKIDFKNTKDLSQDQLSGIFSEPADPIFYETLKSLRSSAQAILDLPDDMATRLVPFAVSYSYGNDGRMGAVITCKFLIPSTDKVTVISTPLTRCYEGGKDEQKCFTPATAKKLWALEKEARRYLAGDRAQTTLYDEQTPQQEQEAGPALNEPEPPAIEA